MALAKAALQLCGVLPDDAVVNALCSLCPSGAEFVCRCAKAYRKANNGPHHDSFVPKTAIRLLAKARSAVLSPELLPARNVWGVHGIERHLQVVKYSDEGFIIDQVGAKNGEGVKVKPQRVYRAIKVQVPPVVMWQLLHVASEILDANPSEEEPD